MGVTLSTQYQSCQYHTGSLRSLSDGHWGLLGLLVRIGWIRCLKGERVPTVLSEVSVPFGGRNGVPGSTVELEVGSVDTRSLLLPRFLSSRAGQGTHLLRALRVGQADEVEGRKDPGCIRTLV